ncbi:hypothetical protein NMY22_g104 [Coprinellus aureogranulatus]|nr:hypothetical protein NMY22_g104 [Coprinellus aureogranulatus]
MDQQPEFTLDASKPWSLASPSWVSPCNGLRIRRVGAWKSAMAAVQTALATPELLAMIFSNLKEKNTKWKGATAKLSAVNQGFFHASIAVVWEDMHSFEPFCPLLFPHPATSANLPAGPGGGSEHALARFELYASKTKALILNDPVSLLDNPSWAFNWHLDKRNLGSIKLFPALSALYLNSADPLSLFIALSVCQRIQLLSIFLDPASVTQGVKDAILELASRTGQRNCSIRFLNCLHPGGLQFLSRGPIFEFLERTEITVGAGDLEALEPILWAPNKVVIGEAPWNWVALDYRASRDSSVAGSSVEEVARVCREDIRELALAGPSGFIEAIGSHPCRPSVSQRFERVVLKVAPLGSDEVPLTPITIARFIDANPYLAQLVVRTFLNIPQHGPGAYPRPDALPRIRSNPSFLAAPPLLNQLMSAPNLKDIYIERIYFPGGDIILKMIQVLTALPSLESFSFIPYHLSDRQEDAFTYPTLACLVDISLRCPKLHTLKLVVDLHDMVLPVLGSHSTTKDLWTLVLYPCIKGLPAYSMAESMHVAMYLYKLYPDLGTLTSDWEEGDPEWEFWNDIHLIVGGLQGVRDQAVQGVETAGKLSSNP